jgi:hypothetical protein
MEEAEPTQPDSLFWVAAYIKHADVNMSVQPHWVIYKSQQEEGVSSFYRLSRIWGSEGVVSWLLQSQAEQ